MNPLKILLALLIVIPLIEVYLLMQVGTLIGLFPTILLVIVTALMGASLLKSQGLSTLTEAQSSLAQGEIPATQLMEGAVLLVSGALLLTPGFLTDFIGFLGLAPMTRKGMVRWVASRSVVMHQNIYQQADNVTVEGEFHEKHERHLH